ncbi:ABC transporter [Clostridiales bacterium PH28_bin88]|nr:ABC transporter [Clostridiales bacterium PH28_bin88]
MKETGIVKILVSNLQKTYRNRQGEHVHALAGMDLQVREGEFMCLLGPSGCGKSTLLHIMAGFVRPSRGEVLIDGKPVAGPDPRYLTLFQNYGLFPWRSVLGNVEYGLEVQGVPRRERRSRAMEYVSMVGLDRFVHNHPHELSGGMQQRVALARALAVDPDILFMDEPLGALDAITRFRLQEEISRIWRDKGKTIVFVTHDIEEAVYLADRIAVMTPHPGRIKSIVPVPMGRPRDRTHPDFLRVRDQVYSELRLKPENVLDYCI